MEERPASRTVTAYARGLYLAQVFQLAVAGIAVLAVIIGGYMVSRQAEQLGVLKSSVQEAEFRLDDVSEETTIKLAINERLTAAAVALSEARPGDEFGSELAYSRAFDELGKALAIAPDELSGPGPDVWKETRQTIRRMMVGTLTGGQRLGEAITVQQELVSREEAGSPAWATYSTALASLHCQAGDFESAATIVTPDFRTAHPDQLKDNAYVSACAALVASLDEQPSKSVSSEDAPAEAAPAEVAPASAGIHRVFLHIREEGQRPAAANLAERLCETGLSVPGIELVAAPRGYPITPRAIYYYPDQQTDAAAIAAAVQIELTTLGISDWNRPIDTRLYQADNLPRDRVEIWLPETGGQGASLGPGKASCQARVAGAGQITQLVADLNAPDAPTRLSAGQQISNALRGPEKDSAIDALVRQLESPQSETLSGTGRFNILYMLNIVESWQGDPAAARLSAALGAIESGGAAIGGQTRDCIDKIKTKLAGAAAPSTCGGR